MATRDIILPERYLKAKKKSVWQSAISLVSMYFFTPTALALKLTTPLARLFSPGASYYRRSNGILSGIFLIGKIFAIYVCASLIFNPSMVSGVSIGTPAGMAAISFAIAALIFTIFGFFKVVFAGFFWMAVIIFLAGNFNIPNFWGRQSSSEALVAIPQKLANGLEFDEIPEAKPATIKILSRRKDSDSSLPGPFINIDAYNPIKIAQEVYARTSNNINSAYDSTTHAISSSVSNIVSEPIQDALRILNLDSTGFGAELTKFTGGNKGVLPDSVYFGRSHKRRNFYPMRGSGSNRDMESLFSKVGLTR